MVFFVCEGCNESLKKNQVDKHAMRCHGCWAVTCVDCSVTFPGNDYAAHTSCVSEAQKYEGSLYKGKKEKMNAQDKWALVLDYALEHVSEAPDSIRSYVPAICQSANVPRQQKKFTNFAKNSVRLHSPPLLEELWNFLDGCKAKCLPETEPEVTTSEPSAELIPSTMVTEPAEDIASQSEEKSPTDKKDKKSKKKKKNNKDKINLEEKVADIAVVEADKEKKKSKKKPKEQPEVVEKTVREEVALTEGDLKKKEKKEKKKKRKLEKESNEGISLKKSKQ